MTPREHDEKQAALDGDLGMALARRTTARNAVHRLAGDKLRWHGRVQEWGMSYDGALMAVAGTAREGVDPVAVTAARTLADAEFWSKSVAALKDKISVMEAVYRKDPWPRYFPCLNSDGHVHRSERGCSTLRYDTAMGWDTSLSGQPVEACIAKLGPRLCSVCFPDAPAEHCRSLSDITRADREAARAARQEARYAKRLRDNERFRETAHPQWCETVARCKEILRDEVEYRDYYGRGEHSSHAASVTDAARAAEVLLAREAAIPGTGATQDEIDRIIASAVKRNRKDGARI
jgi:hypothetical protein